MEYLFHRINRNIGKTNSLQIIVIAIAIHSIISIVMIYVHLMHFFNTHLSKHQLEHIHSNKGGIYLISNNKQLYSNLMSTNVMKWSSISMSGWWQDHSKWSLQVDCINTEWTVCQQVYFTKCKSDRIRAIYQYIPIQSDVMLSGVEISLKAFAQHLIEQKDEPFYGMLILIKLSDGSSQILRIKFPSELGLWTKRSVRFFTNSSASISSFTVMLMCVGYSGSVYFTDVKIFPMLENFHTNIVSFCNKRLQLNNYYNNLKYESISFPNDGSKSRQKLITFVSQVSMDRLPVLEKSLQTWNGPVSLTIYVPVKDINEGILEWQKIYIEKKLRNINLTADSHINLVAGISEDQYPINSMRNIAIGHVSTKYMFLSDADFQPCPEFEQKVKSFLKHNHVSNTAFIVPAFEYLEMPTKTDGIPKTKEEFLQLILRDDPIVQPFRVFESTDSHRLTDYWKWYYANTPYNISYFSDKYEPYLIVEKTDNFPLFDERLKNYGMNKVVHMTELYAANFSFLVLHNVWITHLPHKTSNYFQEFLQNTEQRLKNRAERFEIISDIINKYKINKQCLIT